MTNIQAEQLQEIHNAIITGSEELIVTEYSLGSYGTVTINLSAGEYTKHDRLYVIYMIARGNASCNGITYGTISNLIYSPIKLSTVSTSSVFALYKLDITDISKDATFSISKSMVDAAFHHGKCWLLKY